MGGIFFFMLEVLCYEVASTAHYFHEPSHVVLTSPDRDNDFGFAIDYKKKTNNLVVGAPRSDWDGKVFTCPLTDITTSTKTNIICNRINIDIGNDFFRNSSDYHCHLGASLAATDDYIFACAPLCSSYVVPSIRPRFGAYEFGTCFVYDGRIAKRFQGLLEMNNTYTNNYYGGVGWTTFSDPKNKIIIIPKSILNNIIYLEMEKPLEPVMQMPTLETVLSLFNYKGLAFAAGTFFENKQYLYAFSMKKKKHTGGIAFMCYNKTTNSFTILEKDNRRRAIIIKDESISMYGTALHSADLNNDNFSELIVGAPAYSTLSGGYDLGAIYLYKGGGEVVERNKPTIHIIATKDGARFGTTITSTDLDGDGFAEIFVSSPYGENGGTVHVLSGYEIRQSLDGSIKEILLSSLRHTQTLHIKDFKSFGYSLHTFERNGVNSLAVGSPFTGNVVLYSSLSLVRVSISTKVQGDKSVREQDTDFTVIVKVKLENLGKTSDSAINTSISSYREHDCCKAFETSELFLSTEVTGGYAKIQGNTIKEIELSRMKLEDTYNVVVLLVKDGPGDYTFTARVKDKKSFYEKDYDSTSVQLTAQSETISVLEVPRHCKGTDCVPQFVTNFEWSGGSEKYILGSNQSETMKLLIDNVGNSTYDSCAWIKVTGAQIAVLECSRPDDIWYRCPLRIERNNRHIITIRLDLSHPTNKDKSLNIEVNLFNHCASSISNATVTKNKEITYIFNNEDIEIKGSSFVRNFTDSEIHNDPSNEIINIDESYTIINNATMSWKRVVAVFQYQDLSFVKKYMIIDGEKCKKNSSKGFVQIKCIIDIDSKSTQFIRTSAILLKSKLISHLSKRKLVFNSTLELHFESADRKFAKYTTTILVQRDAELWENQNIIIMVAVIIALFIVGTLIIILYKNGFFQRKGKQKSTVLRASIRKGTFRRPSTADGATDKNTEDKQDVQL